MGGAKLLTIAYAVNFVEGLTAAVGVKLPVNSEIPDSVGLKR